jgi:hypothetical protein
MTGLMQGEKSEPAGCHFKPGDNAITKGLTLLFSTRKFHFLVTGRAFSLDGIL